MFGKKGFIIVTGAIIFVILLWVIYSSVSNNKESGLESRNEIADSITDTIVQSIEDFAAIDQADYNKFITAANANDGLTTAQKIEALRALGCQNVVDMSMQGYRSLQSGATLKIEEYQELSTSPKKYIIHAAQNLVLSADKVTGQLTRVVKNTKDPQQLFTREELTETGAPTKYYFTMVLSSGVKFAIQYEHESISLRPLNNVTPWPGQQFILDANLKGDVLDASALSLGYKVAPGLSAADIQNVGLVAVQGSLTGESVSNVPVTTVASGAAPGTLGALTESQFKSVLKASLSDIGAFNQITGGQQPGTQNNPFANKPLKINLNLAGLATKSAPTLASDGGLSGLVSGFEDVPVKNTKHTEAFTEMSSGSGTGQVRSLIQAWDAAQNAGSENDFGGFPSSAGSLGSALRGKLASCPKIDRTQYYTERQLAQCAGCTPDPYLRGQLGGVVYQ